ncbi:MAG: hypothetical protein PHF86_02230 [Candidatus Nanoarchaeia archaeon]|nr:hypothetical protein [Candidatus Nanoarchaeia archaeon]
MLKLVKEALDFERNQEPKKSMSIGKESLYIKQQIFNKLEKDGILFHHSSDEKDEKYLMDQYLKDIYKIKEIIQKLQKLNIPIIIITGSAETSIGISIQVYQILDGNHVILSCVTKEDAEHLIKEMKKYAFRNYENFSISDDGEEVIYLFNTIWLDETIERRKNL